MDIDRTSLRARIWHVVEKYPWWGKCLVTLIVLPLLVACLPFVFVAMLVGFAWDIVRLVLDPNASIY